MACTTPTSFKYSPLNRERAEIRLLRLLPSADGSSPLACDVEHVSLDGDDAHYEALSYTWGGDAKTDTISLGGTAFPVTKNLFTALHALRGEHSDRRLWIDAVCINQDDVLERNQEVLRMLQIYRRAERVVVWLGEADDDSTSAFNHLLGLVDCWKHDHDKRITARMARFSKRAIIRTAAGAGAITATARSRPFLTAWAVAYCARLIPPRTGLLSLASRITTTWSFCALGLGVLGAYRSTIERVTDKASVPDATTVKVLASLFTRAWFRRVWIVQEIAAARDAVLLCGRDSMSWRDLCRACEQMERLIGRTSSRNPYVDCQFRRSQDTRMAFNPNKPSSERARLRWNLLFLLTHFSNFGATNPRDKVYGLLGLASEYHQQQDEERAMMVPDYNKPLNTVYAETVKFVVTRMGSLDILRACDGFHTMPGLPSWAPDWTHNVFRSINPPRGQLKPYGLPSDPNPAQPVARFLDIPLSMTVRGFIMGHLVDSGRILFTLPDRTQGHQFQEGTRGYLDLIMKYFVPNITWLMRSGIFGFCAKSAIRLFIRFYPEAETGMTPYLSMIDDLVNMSITDVDNSGGDDDDAGEYGITMANILDPPDMDAEETALRSVDWKPLLQNPTMDPGHCHTYTPSPREGDLVCMFIGASEPYIVRKDGDHYVLLCSATFGPFNRYLWVDCEREHREGTLLLQEFRLRGLCADVGSICCGDGVCKPGAACLTSEDGTTTCCEQGCQACNNGGCCDEGAECSRDGDSCETIESSTVSISIASSTEAASSASELAASAPEPSSTPPPSSSEVPASSETPSSSFCTFTGRQTSFTCTTTPTAAVRRRARATEAAEPRGLDERQSSGGDSFLQYGNLYGQEIPVMIFPWVPGETEELISPTCNGIGGGDQIIMTARIRPLVAVVPLVP